MLQHKEVKIAWVKTELLPIDDLEQFQGNLKELSKVNYEKLKKQILDLGFSEPVSAWDNDGRWKLLNGHQRLRTLKRMREEGYDVPAIPVNLIRARTEREAKKKVLALTSQFGEMTKDGLYEFMSDADLTMEDVSDLRFPEVDLIEFNEEFFEERTPSEPPPSSGGSPGQIVHTCPKCKFRFTSAAVDSNS